MTNKQALELERRKEERRAALRDVLANYECPPDCACRGRRSTDAR